MLDRGYAVESQTLHCIVAYVKPRRLQAIVDALRRLRNFPGMSVAEVRGFGRRAVHPPTAGESTEVDLFEAKLRIEVYCPCGQSSDIVSALQSAARTGNAGDGMIFVSDAAWAVRIRTNSVGVAAVLEDGEVAR